MGSRRRMPRARPRRPWTLHARPGVAGHNARLDAGDVPVQQDHGDAGGAGGPLHALGQQREKGVGDVRNHESDGQGALRAQPAGQGVRREVQLANGVLGETPVRSATSLTLGMIRPLCLMKAENEQGRQRCGCRPCVIASRAPQHVWSGRPTAGRTAPGPCTSWGASAPPALPLGVAGSPRPAAVPLTGQATAGGQKAAGVRRAAVAARSGGGETCQPGRRPGHAAALLRSGARRRVGWA